MNRVRARACTSAFGFKPTRRRRGVCVRRPGMAGSDYAALPVRRLCEARSSMLLAFGSSAGCGACQPKSRQARCVRARRARRLAGTVSCASASSSSASASSWSLSAATPAAATAPAAAAPKSTSTPARACAAAASAVADAGLSSASNGGAAKRTLFPRAAGLCGASADPLSRRRHARAARVAESKPTTTGVATRVKAITMKAKQSRRTHGTPERTCNTSSKREKNHMKEPRSLRMPLDLDPAIFGVCVLALLKVLAFTSSGAFSDSSLYTKAFSPFTHEGLKVCISDKKREGASITSAFLVMIECSIYSQASSTENIDT
mmetsp:Transcript_80791/g.246874  ORF Transcript_80791/g.246874 Transcript_80791/m.246874 type:complete len:319 (-) Transcript_80791:70-1026(-)